MRDTGGFGLNSKQFGDTLQALCRFSGEVASGAQHAAKRRKSFTPHLVIARQEVGNGGERRLLVDQEHVVLLAHERLELGQGWPRLVVLDRPQAAESGEPALVGAPARHADVKQAAHETLAQAAGWDAQFQLSDAGL